MEFQLRTAELTDLDGIYALYQAEKWTNFSREKNTGHDSRSSIHLSPFGKRWPNTCFYSLTR